MTEHTWGHLAPLEGYGRAGDKKEDYELLSYDRAVKDYADYQHATHAMLFARDDAAIWKLYKLRAAVMMQMRFDGLLGFPGGLVDPGEDCLTAVNRELEEEIYLDLNKHRIQEENHVLCNLHPTKKLILHFYVKEVSLSDFVEIERRSLSAPEYGIETLGSIRPPLFTMGDGYRGLPAFLGNQFAGNSREQLLQTLTKMKILEEQEVVNALKAYENFKKPSS